MQNKTKYHILFTSAWYPSRVEQYNGNFVKRHALAVSTMQKVTVLYIQSDENCKKVETFITQINENFKEIIVYFPRNKIHFLNPIIKLFLFQKYVKWVGKFDLIHHNVLFLETIWVYFRKLFYKTPFVITEHWTRYTENTPKKFPKIWLIIASFLAKKAKFILPVSKALQTSMQNLGIKANYKVIPNVIDTELFSLKPSINNEIVTFVHISNLKQEHKNIYGILNVLIRLSEEKYKYKMIFAGENSFDEYQNFINMKGIQKDIKFIGKLSQAEVCSILKSSDCFLLFSNYETQGCVLLESLSCGTPIIATNVGGIPENFIEYFGYLVEKQDENALYKAMITFIKKEKDYKKKEMHAFIEQKFSIKTIAKEFNLLYKLILN